MELDLAAQRESEEALQIVTAIKGLSVRNYRFVNVLLLLIVANTLLLLC